MCIVGSHHANSPHIFQLARPCLEIKGADVVLEDFAVRLRLVFSTGRVIVHEGGAEVDVAVAEVRGGAVGHVDGDEGEEHEDGVHDVQEHDVAAECPALGLHYVIRQHEGAVKRGVSRMGMVCYVPACRPSSLQ